MSEITKGPEPYPRNDGDEVPKAPQKPIVHSETETGSGWPFALLIFVLPPLIYYFWLSIHKNGGALLLPRSLSELKDLLAQVPRPTLQAVLLYGGWIGLQLLLQIYAPGPWKKGARLADGSQLSYKMNGWVSFWVTMSLAGGLCLLGVVPATLLADQFGPILTVANLFTFGLSLYVYLLGRRGSTNPSRPIADYFLGSALNPRNGNLDWKFFCESRPGLILWALINLSFAAKQIQLHGSLSTPMLIVCAAQLLYVIDYFYFEEAILSTWDIRHENFGWMLCWGSLVWVPFTYSLQAQYLVTHTHDLPLWASVGIVVLNLLGFVLFRVSNLQKHRFRENPETLIWGKKAEYLRTKQGNLLLTSGFWGVARHLNYTGDLLMGLAWCLPCGFGHVLPYFYFVYFAILLIHREHRDQQGCAKRYGEDWETYCKLVKWRMVPFLY